MRRVNAGLPPGRRSPAAGFALAAALLAGCASGPPSAPATGPVAALPAPASSSDRDGPSAALPAELERTPDPEPQVETIRPGGPNKPYEVLGQRYTPVPRDEPIRETGIASWYGRKFHGRRTASGELYDMHAMTAAHKTMPLPSYARVRNPKNGREIVVRVNDRGPFVAGRIIDLSYAAAIKLGVADGVAPVEVERLTHEAIRSGSWRRDGPGPALDATDVAAAPPATPAPTAEPAALSPPPAPVGEAPAARALTKGARGWWIQLGAFRERDGASGFQRRVAGELDWLAPLLAMFGDASLYRVQAGPYASRDEAQEAAQRVREALQLVPMVVERR